MPSIDTLIIFNTSICCTDSAKLLEQATQIYQFYSRRPQNNTNHNLAVFQQNTNIPPHDVSYILTFISLGNKAPPTPTEPQFRFIMAWFRPHKTKSETSRPSLRFVRTVGPLTLNHRTGTKYHVVATEPRGELFLGTQASTPKCGIVCVITCGTF